MSVKWIANQVNETSRFFKERIEFIIFKTMKPESTSKAALFETNWLILLSFIFFFYVISDWHLLIVFIFLQMHLDWPFCQKTSMKIQAFNKIQYFTLQFTHTRDDLISYRINYLCIFYTITKVKGMNNIFFLHVLPLLSGDISWNPGSTYNNQSLESIRWNAFKSKGIHLIHLNFNRLLPKIYEIRYIAERTNTAKIVITESKLYESTFQWQIQRDNYDLIQCDKNNYGGDITCYIRILVTYRKTFFQL